MSNTRIYWIHALSPTHAGIGRGVEYIDLPIDRDKVTGWPIIRASGFKGVWADYFRATDAARKTDPVLRAAFGATADDIDANSGSLIPSDAQLVCLPVRSFYGTFAWVTSPLCLGMLRRTLRLSGMKDLPDEPHHLDGQTAHHPAGSKLVQAEKDGGKVFLEDLDLNASQCAKAEAWAARLAGWVFADDQQWQAVFKERFIVIPDTVFGYLCETGTEVHTRVRIDDDTKTVAQGALWTEESLPAETIMAGVVQCERVFGLNSGKANGNISPDDLLRKFATEPLLLQIGGKATVGRGRVRCVFTPVNGGAK